MTSPDVAPTPRCVSRNGASRGSRPFFPSRGLGGRLVRNLFEHAAALLVVLLARARPPHRRTFAGRPRRSSVPRAGALRLGLGCRQPSLFGGDGFGRAASLAQAAPVRPPRAGRCDGHGCDRRCRRGRRQGAAGGTAASGGGRTGGGGRGSRAQRAGRAGPSIRVGIAAPSRRRVAAATRPSRTRTNGTSRPPLNASRQRSMARP